MAADLGVDKIFGKGTTPGEVASYLAHVLAPGAALGTGWRPTATAGVSGKRRE